MFLQTIVFSFIFWQQTLFWKILPGPSMYKLQMKANLLSFKSGKNLGVESAASFPMVSPLPHHHHHPGRPCNTVSHKHKLLFHRVAGVWNSEIYSRVYHWSRVSEDDCETLDWHQMSSGTQPESCQCWAQARPSLAHSVYLFPKLLECPHIMADALWTSDLNVTGKPQCPSWCLSSRGYTVPSPHYLSGQPALYTERLPKLATWKVHIA